MLTSTRLLLYHKSPGAFYLYAPPLGLPVHRVRNELQQLVGVRLVWYNHLALVREYHARHWVAQHENALGYATTGRYKDYLLPLVATAGFTSAVESLRSVATLLLRMLEYPDPMAALATVELLVVRDVNPVGASA